MIERKSEQEIRREKVDLLRAQGINPYPAQSARTITVRGFLDAFDDYIHSQDEETFTGRIRLQRGHGKITFMHLEDASGRIQIVVSVDHSGKDVFSFTEDFVDVGDIVQITGKAFVTKKGEQSVLASNVEILTKAIQPLPDKWKGIQDEEERYRRRYVDMIMDPDLREIFRKKSIFWNSMRMFLVQEGFLEVETPVLETTPGGADAEPFSTHHNALNIDLYLRISMGELWQKRLMVGGFEKTFEIGRQFRNEGLSPEHLQDYTQMEFYYGYADYEMGMDLVERMYKHVIQATFGTMQFQIRGFDVDFDQDWKRLDYREAILNEVGVDIRIATDEELVKAAEEFDVKDAKDIVGRGRLIDAIWKYCRKSVGGPVFLTGHPVDVSPLAKRHSENPDTVERFQVIIAGSEVGNGYSELNDPVDQANRFEGQTALREAGDAEAQMHDREYVQALEYAMPPTCGFGVSERMFSFLMDKPIKECVMFPLLRPKHDPHEQEVTVQSGSASLRTVSQDTDASLEAFDVGMTRDEAEAFVFEHVKDENLRRHMLATEKLMFALGEHFQVAQPENWGIAGLVHDIDYENCDMKEHSLIGAKMLEEKGVHSLIVDAVREHNYVHGFQPKTLMSKAMMSLEQLTGLITATTYVRPDKSIHSVKVKSVKKKLKDKSFASGVDRTMINKSEELTGLTVDEAIHICLEAMQKNADTLGLG